MENKLIEDKLKALTIPLSVSEIDFRVQSVNAGGYATILAYKNARVDMQRLDDCIGAMNWKREHTRDNHNCIVSIYDTEKKEWISKEDTGTESFTEKEKGLASDSFKRACFNWGIGRELYDYPIIKVKLFENEFKVEGAKVKATWDLRLKDWKWECQFNDGKLVSLIGVDNNGVRRYSYLIDSKDSVPTEDEKALLIKLVYGTNYDDEKKSLAFEAIRNCNNYDQYTKIQHKLEHEQLPIDQIENPNQTDIKKHLKKITG